MNFCADRCAVRAFALICGFVFSCHNAMAATFELTPADNWFDYLTNPALLAPGDEVVLAPGTYSTSARISIPHRGTAGAPITIRAADGAQAIITRPNANQNTLNLEGAQYLTLQGLEVTGGSIGIRIDQKIEDDVLYPAKFITLDGNRIHHTGDAAVTANFNGRTYEGLHFLRNEIHDTSGAGEGFYLGCNNNACQMFDSVIEQNYIHHLDGPGVSQGDGIEIKDGSYNNVVRDNVIHDTNYPGILVYGVEEQGARNIIEGNVIWNSGDHAIQAAADAVVRNNLIFSSSLDGIHSQNHQGAVPGNLTIVNNTIRTSGNAIDVGSPAGDSLSGPVVIANNALYPVSGSALDLADVGGYTIASNIGSGSSNLSLTTGEFDSTGSASTDFVNLTGDNAYPKVGSALIGAGDATYQPAADFNGTPRSGTADVGAYVYNSSGNPGWAVQMAFKQFIAPNGDFNNDGKVDGKDFLQWQRGASPVALSSTDLAAWKANFGAPLAAIRAVPEPSTLLQIATLVISAALQRGLRCPAFR